VLDSVASEVGVVMLELGDLMEHEEIYAYLLYLQKTDVLHHFMVFHSFMRQQSVMGVLQLNRTINCQLSQKIRPIDIS
jgi:hypothetical protein